MSIGFLHTQLFLFHKPEPIRQSTLLMALATSLESGPAMIASLEALAADAAGDWKHMLTRLKYLLQDGSTLSEATAATQGLLPERTVIAIRTAEPAGALKQVLAEEAMALNDQMKTSAGQPRFATSVIGLSILFFATLWILTFVMIFIVPKLKDIFEGFGHPLPQATMLLIDLSNVFFSNWLLLALPAITFAGYFVFFSVYSRWQYLTRGFVPLVPWWPRFWTPQILRSLSVTVAAKEPLSEAFHALLSEMRPGRAATALSAVRTQVEAGESAWTSMQRQGFLKSSEVAVLESAEAAEHLDWALQHVSIEVERRRRSRLQILATFVHAGLMLIVGVLILFVVVSLYLPLAQLSNNDFGGGI